MNDKATIADVREALRREGTATIRGFGTFTKVTRKAREARNPRTGEAVHVPDREAIKFKPAKGALDAA